MVSNRYLEANNYLVLCYLCHQNKKEMFQFRVGVGREMTMLVSFCQDCMKQKAIEDGKNIKDCTNSM